jgi:hypothetical protein
MAREITYRGFILRTEAERAGPGAWAVTVDIRLEGSQQTNGKQFAPPTPRGLFRSETKAEDAAFEHGKAMVRSGDAAR